MPYWVEILSPAITSPNGQPQHENASVVGPLSKAQVIQQFGTVNNGLNPSNGYATKLSAQVAANKFNAQPASKRETPGSAPNAPTAAKVPGPADLFHGLNIGGIILRLGEIVLGVVLIGVGVAKLTGTDNFIVKAATTVGKAALI